MIFEALIGLLIVMVMSATQAIKKWFKWSEDVDTRWIAGTLGVILGMATWALGFYAKIDPTLGYQEIVYFILAGIFLPQLAYDKLAKSKDK